MRIAPLIAALGLLGVACASSERQAMVSSQPTTTFEATVVDGDAVTVAQDTRTGDMWIVAPASRNGERVALVSAHGGIGGAALVTPRATPPSTTSHGSAGDRVEPH